MLDETKMPKHIALIVDGNRRWAREKGLFDFQGHEKGAQNMYDITLFCSKIHLCYLTIYAFSIENFKRDAMEVKLLMRIFDTYFKRMKKEACHQNILIQVIGRKELLPLYLQETIAKTEEATKQCTGLVLTIALAYSGRLEIVDAFHTIIERIEKGMINIQDVTEEMISKNLYTFHLPDPDLLIRTGKEKRISNFMNWQIAYTEFYYTDKYWPDFNQETLLSAINDYSQRKRRYGGNGIWNKK